MKALWQVIFLNFIVIYTEFVRTKSQNTKLLKLLKKRAYGTNGNIKNKGRKKALTKQNKSVVITN